MGRGVSENAQEKNMRCKHSGLWPDPVELKLAPDCLHLLNNKPSPSAGDNFFNRESTLIPVGVEFRIDIELFPNASSEKLCFKLFPSEKINSVDIW